MPRPTDKQSERQRLTDDIVAKLAAPATGNKIYYDLPNRRGNDWTPGFGVRVTAGGARTFVLNYRTKGGRHRRYTIGSPPVWTVTAAREEAATLKAEVTKGGDPQGKVDAVRDALSV